MNCLRRLKFFCVQNQKNSSAYPEFDQAVRHGCRGQAAAIVKTQLTKRVGQRVEQDAGKDAPRLQAKRRQHKRISDNRDQEVQKAFPVLAHAGKEEQGMCQSAHTRPTPRLMKMGLVFCR